MTTQQHNGNLTTAFLQKRGVKSLFPAIHTLFPSAVVNRKALNPGAYNPSILTKDGKTLMSYRYHPSKAPNTKLAIAELDGSFNVVRKRDVEAQGGSIEDGRLFLMGGEPWISYTVSQGPAGAWKCCVRYGRLVEAGDKWAIEGQHLVAHGDNSGTGMEKNWVFFEDAGRLNCFYKADQILSIRGNEVANVAETKTQKWAWGTIRGGTVPFKHKGALIRFFHSRLDNEPRPTYWRYFVGAMLLEPEWPYAVLEVSKSPILRGSEIDSVPEDERREIFHHKPNVVFPCGAIEHGSGWLLSVGVNDCECVLVKLEEKDLKL